jgi:signal transduction histidine kinase
MTSIKEHTHVFVNIACKTLTEMFGVEAIPDERVEEVNSVHTDKTFIVSVYYTGTVYGEYLLAMDEATAANIVGISEELTDENRDRIREDICDAMSETLNTIVGEAMVDLQGTYAKLTLTAPRIFFGSVRYPHFRTGQAVVHTPMGRVECHFCLDSMRLDLATSYQEAMQSLVDVNSKLKEANRHLAQQQAQLVQTEKMASIGILASGVAHEINNPLFFVDANLNTLNDYVHVIDSMLALYDQLCNTMHGGDSSWPIKVSSIREEAQQQDFDFVMQDTKQLVVETRQGVERIKAIVQGLRDFSQIDRCGFAETDINVILENTCVLIGSQLPTSCLLRKDFSSLPRLVCNAGEIGQVLLGVLLNAGQAVAGGGNVRIASSANDSSILITVEDDGYGIASEHIDHIFEPFFTTKPVGEGAGLGLSIAYGIIQKHNGSISIESQEGAGTKVTIRLPLAIEHAPCPS